MSAAKAAERVRSATMMGSCKPSASKTSSLMEVEQEEGPVMAAAASATDSTKDVWRKNKQKWEADSWSWEGSAWGGDRGTWIER